MIYVNNTREGCAKRVKVSGLSFHVFFSRHRKPGMGSYPINGIFLGDEFSKVVDGAIPPHYLHAPNIALSHRQ